MTSIEPGKYVFKNRLGEVALDLSGGDNKSIIGFTAHGGENQQVCSVFKSANRTPF